MKDAKIEVFSSPATGPIRATIEYHVRRDRPDLAQVAYIELERWGAGPWDDEPDKVQWQDDETGLPCLAVRNALGRSSGMSQARNRARRPS